VSAVRVVTKLTWGPRNYLGGEKKRVAERRKGTAFFRNVYVRMKSNRGGGCGKSRFAFGESKKKEGDARGLARRLARLDHGGGGGWVS